MIFGRKFVFNDKIMIKFDLFFSHLPTSRHKSLCVVLKAYLIKCHLSKNNLWWDTSRSRTNVNLSYFKNYDLE